MIIDQLTPVTADNLTDELPVEQGTTTFKTTLQKILDLFSGTASPQMDGTASAGTASTLSKSDHRHPHDTSKLDVYGGSYAYWGDASTNLNNFYSGVLIAGSSVVNNPFGARCLIISAGDDTKVTQVAISSTNDGAPKLRYMNNGTWGAWTGIEGIQDKVLYFTSVPCTAMTGNFVEYFNSAITSNHILASVQFAKPSAISPYLTWNTSGSNQRLRINGTCTEATTCNVLLIKKDN